MIDEEIDKNGAKETPKPDSAAPEPSNKVPQTVDPTWFNELMGSSWRILWFNQWIKSIPHKPVKILKDKQ